MVIQRDPRVVPECDPLTWFRKPLGAVRARDPAFAVGFARTWPLRDEIPRALTGVGEDSSGTGLAVLGLRGAAPAGIVTNGLAIHYDANNADGNGTPGPDLSSPTAIENLAQSGSDDQIRQNFAATIPEPASLALLGMGAGLLLIGGGRRKRPGRRCTRQ